MNHAIVPSCKWDVMKMLRHVHRGGSNIYAHVRSTCRLYTILAYWCSVLPRGHEQGGESQTWCQGCISCGPCSCPELTEDHVLPSAYVEIFRTVTRNAVNKSVWRKKDCFWLPLNKHAMNIWLSSLRIRAHLSWRTGKHLHVLYVLRTYSTCSYPGYQDTAIYAALTSAWSCRASVSPVVCCFHPCHCGVRRPLTLRLLPWQ